MKNMLLAMVIALILGGSATSSPPPNLHSASTQQLLDRRAEIDRKLREGDFGVYIGMIRWISHASEKKSVLQERDAIDAELARRHVTPPREATNPPEGARQ